MQLHHVKCNIFHLTILFFVPTFMCKYVQATFDHIQFIEAPDNTEPSANQNPPCLCCVSIFTVNMRFHLKYRLVKRFKN